LYGGDVPEIDSYDLRATLRSVYSGVLSADEAKAILGVTRRAAAADEKTDIGEMTMLLRIKDLLAQMAGEADLPISGNVDAVQAGELSRGARELAFACAYLVMAHDLHVADQEKALTATLAAELRLDELRGHELIAMIDWLVRAT
jgi:hypothetical protein